MESEPGRFSPAVFRRFDVPAYDRLAMRSRRPVVLAMPVVLAASQVGHLLSTELQQGPRTLTLDHSGAHAYIPMLLALALGAGGAVVMGALLLVAAARVVRAGHRRAGGPTPGGSLLDLWAALFACQLAIFMVQETVESLAYGGSAPSLVSLVLWGSFGQLPLAAVAAAVLRCFLARVEASADDLAAAAGRPLVPGAVLPPIQPAFIPATSVPRRRVRARARGQRAPPVSFRLQLIT